jgi:hypothetical protein
MSENMVICERAAGCDYKPCPYIRPTHGDTMRSARCSHINGQVNIIEYNSLDKGNPNRLFKGRIHGLRSR